MASHPIPFRLPTALLDRMDSLAKKAGLTRADIVRLSLMRVLDIAETDPSALLKFIPELLAMDGRRSASMIQSSARVAEGGFTELKQAQAGPKKPVDYRKALKEDRKKGPKKDR